MKIVSNLLVYSGAEERYLLRGARVNKKNEILTNFQNFT